MNRRTVQFRLNRLFVFYLNPMGEHGLKVVSADSDGFSWIGFS